jgi:hypothetical protein
MFQRPNCRGAARSSHDSLHFTAERSTLHKLNTSANAAQQQQQQQRQHLQTSQCLHETLVKGYTTRLKIMKEALEDDMSMHAENSPESATTTCNRTSLSDSDDLSGDEEPSPYSSPPPALRMSPSNHLPQAEHRGERLRKS